MTLKEYLINLAKDPVLVKALRENPAKAMAAAGLSQADQEIIKEADPAKIRTVLGGGAAADNVTVVVVIAVFI